MGKKKKPRVPSLLTAEQSAPAPYLGVQSGGTVVLQQKVPPPPVPTLSSIGASAKRAKKEIADTAGAAWNHMRAPELTQEVKRELLVLKMRGVLDPKRFYRSSDHGKALPKYFQLGEIISGAEDGRNRLTKRERKTSILGEVMGDGAVRKRAKSQFQKVQAATSEGVKRSVKPGKKKGIGKSKR